MPQRSNAARWEFYPVGRGFRFQIGNQVGNLYGIKILGKMSDLNSKIAPILECPTVQRVGCAKASALELPNTLNA
jgi:hypothetical protein